MAGVIDLTDGGSHEVLTSTGSGGLLGGQYLDGEPLESYLEGDEQPKYVLRNKNSGLQVERDGETRSVEPGEAYQILAMVTDLRILFVVGEQGGDRTVSIDLSDVVEARVESGRFRTSTLSLELLSGDRVVFPCRGDPSAVASYVEDAAQIYANAGRLLDEVEAALAAAREELDSGDYESAAEEIADGEETVQTARNRLSELGQAAVERMADRAQRLRTGLVDTKRAIQTTSAASDHATAQERWGENEYEAAARAYESAIQGYERALETDGSTPPDTPVRSRLAGARSERALLRIGPIVDADTRRRRARALADPEAAATEWEEAYEQYRDLLDLEWAADGRDFAADKEVIREQTVEIVDDAISDHEEAGRRWLTSGDKLAVQDRMNQAQQVYERANHQFERAHRLAREFRPERVDAVEDAMAAATLRLEGTVPTETVPDDPIGFEAGDGETADGPESAELPDAEDIEGLSFHDSSSVQPETEASTSGSHSRRFASTPVRNERSETSVLDRIQAQKQSDTVGERSPTTGDHADSTAQPAGNNSGSPSTETLERALATLDGRRLADLVAAVWELQGWMTEQFTGRTDTVYDVVAIRNDPERRQLIWAEAGGGGLAETVFKQCTTALDSSQADLAVVVTASPVSKSARTRAEEYGVRLVGGPEFVAQVQEVGLGYRLVDLGDSEDESPQA